MSDAAFPIDPLLPDIAASLRMHPRLVLEAPPGAGKTTRVPLALLREGWLEGRRIVMLEPRRVAARAAAGFMSRQLGEDVGGTVGYRIRFDSRVSERTRIEVVTEGILARMLQDDPGLAGVGAVLFDEFHERHLSGDLGLALALDVQGSLRPDLRLLVMSATLDGERLARWLDAPRLSSEGRGFPVDVAHFPAQRDEALHVQVRRAVEHAAAAHPGDVLVFLPGQREIARARRALRAAASLDGLDILELHGELPVERQAEVLGADPAGRRRVVLATNVAESSVTLPAVRVVVDTGLAREPRYDASSGFSRLDTVRVSQASADQRSGRAGRVAAGWAYRLWPQSLRLEPERRAEIAQVELAGLALELAAWGSSELAFVDPPPPGALAAAQDVLRRLGAIDAAGRMTATGRRMHATGAHPRLAAMLVAPGDGKGRALACDLVALLDARDPLRTRSDSLAARWRALAAFRAGRVPGDADRNALAAIDAAARQWRRRVRASDPPPGEVAAHVLGDLLAHAFPDRIAFRHPGDRMRYQLANGRMARLGEDSSLVGEPWLVAHELRHATGDALVLSGVAVDEASLRTSLPGGFREEDETRWDAARRAVVVERVRRFEGIVLDARPGGPPDPARAAAALVAAVRDLGLDALPWTDALRTWRARVQSVRAWVPGVGLPDMADHSLLADLEAWLLPALQGKSRLDAVSSEELAAALRARCEWEALRAVDRLAPVRVAVPSGMERAIGYGLDAAGEPEPPVLAVKLQELFGLADTPRIAEGRVPLTLHLLSPAGRPLQVTQDLRGFWDRTWPEVRREMKGRYPRHPWPEDPWNAVATHRAKPRGT